MAAKKSERPSHPMVGKKAPNFELQDATGKKVSLHDLIRDKALVLYFYPKDMTTGCTKEACDFRDNSKAIGGRGARVAGVSFDSSESHQKFRDKHDLNFSLLADTDKEVAKRYGVYKKKSLYGREFMGIERTTFIIDKQGIVRRVFPKVRVDRHANAVIDALKELD